MADSKETVIFEVNVDSYEEKLAELTKSINGLIDVQSEYRKQAKDGSVEAAQSLERVNAQIKLQKQEYTAAFSVLTGYIGAKKKEIDTNNFLNNSVNQNRALLKQLTAQYNDLAGAGRDKLVPVIKQLSDNLKTQEGQIGDTRRNVGNYKESFLNAFNTIADGIPALQNFKKAQEAVNLAMESNPIGAVAIALESLIGVFRSFEPIANGVEDSITAIASAFGLAYSKGVALNQMLRDQEDASRIAIIRNAQMAKSINELEAVAANKAADDQKRITALKEANELRLSDLELKKKDLEQDKKIADEQVAASIETNKNKAAALGAFKVLLGIRSDTEIKASKETLQRQAETNAALIKLEDDYNQQTIENKNKIDMLEKSIADDRLNRDKEYADKKRKIEDDNLSKLINDSRNSELALKELRDNRLMEEDLMRVTKLSREEIDAKFEKAQLEDRFLTFKEFYDNLKKQYEQDAKDKTQFVRMSEAEISEIKRQYDEKNQQTADKALKKYKDDQNAILNGIIQIVQEAANFLGKIGELLQQESAQNIEAIRAQYEAGQITQQQFNAQAKAEKQKAFKEAKALNITMAVMNTANSIMAQLANPTPYVGIVLAALAAATGAAQIAIISKQQPPKFASGVIGLNGAGTETSDSIDAKLSRGESVMTAKATKRYHRELAEMEMSVGNVPNYNFSSKKFAMGVIGANENTFGGFVSRETTRQTSIGIDNITIIEKIVKNMPAPELSIVEFKKKTSARNRSVNVSEL